MNGVHAYKLIITTNLNKLQMPKRSPVCWYCTKIHLSVTNLLKYLPRL